MTCVYDIECYHQLFLVVFLDVETDNIHTFTIYKDIDERKELFSFLSKVKGLIGYNNINYDMQLIEYLYRNPEASVYDLRRYSDIIINGNEFGDVPDWKFRIMNLDLYRLHHYDNKNKRTSLKWLEYSMDMENIEDLPSDGVGENWLEKVTEYCINDVLSTYELYKKSKPQIELRKKLRIKYGLNCLSWSNSKIGSELCLKLYCEATNQYKSDVRSKRTVRSFVNVDEIIFNYISFESLEFNAVLNFFKGLSVTKLKEEVEYNVNYKDLEYYYGAGGIHASVKNKIFNSDDNRIIIDADVASLYPSIAIKNGLYPEHLGEDFSRVYDEDIVSVRLAEKAKGKDGDKAIIDGLKEAANSVYGLSNNEYSWLRDMKYTLSTTINGQLMLSMLAEKLSKIKNLNIIQVNTDGITVILDRKDVDEYYSICKDWENLTRLNLEYANYKKMVISDVNNYLSIYENGKYKCKGKYEFENIPLHKNKSFSIIPRAVFEYFANNVPIETTVYSSNNIFEFCAGVRSKKTELSGASWFELWSLKDDNLHREKLSKTIRYYISKGGKTLMKCYESGNYEHVEAPLESGKTKKHFKCQVFNKSWKDEMKNYNIDYSYYIYKINKMIHDVEGNKKQNTIW